MNAHGPSSSHSHARPPRHRFGRLLSLVKGHGDLPEAPALDLQDHDDGMNIALRAIRPLPEEWWGETTMDYPPAHDRPYVPEPPAAPAYVPDIYDDLRDLPLLRDAIRAATQRGCTQCGTCGRPLKGTTWAQRFAAQLAHLGSGEDAPSTGTLPAFPDFDLRRYDGMAEEGVAQSLAAVEAEWAAGRSAADALAMCPEYAARHETGDEAAA